MSVGVRRFGAPHRYLQGPGAFEMLGPVLAGIGGTPVIVADAVILGMISPRLERLLAEHRVDALLRRFEGEITYDAVAHLAASLDAAAPSAAVGIGGGKSLDAAKALALRLDLPVVTVPTIASNDSPTSGSIAMYDENHVMVAVDRLKRSPDAVIVDTALIAAAPVRFFRAGVGDAISKKFEADGCWAGSGVTPFGTRPTRTAIAIADACYRTLRRHAAAALAAVERGEATDDVEAVVEANILMSGLGFENGGLSLAHSLTRGLVKIRGARDAIHGYHVSWGTLVQLAAEDHDDGAIRDLAGFLVGIGLPTTLPGLGMDDPAPGEIADIARWTMTAPHLKNLAVDVSAERITAAIHRIERLCAAPRPGRT